MAALISAEIFSIVPAHRVCVPEVTMVSILLPALFTVQYTLSGITS